MLLTFDAHLLKIRSAVVDVLTGLVWIVALKRKCCYYYSRSAENEKALKEMSYSDKWALS